MKERQSPYFLSEFSRIMAAKTLKNPYRLQTMTLKLSKKEKEPKIRKEKPKVTYTVALVMAFLAAENENRLLEDLLQADFGLTFERFLLSVRTTSTWENAFDYKNNNGRNF